MEGTTPAANLTYAECVRRLEAAREAAAALPSLTWQATGADLATGMETLGEVAAACEGAEVAITRDAIDRGEPACAFPPQSPREWVMSHHRRYAVAGASRLVAVADACRNPHHTILADAVTTGRVSVTAAQVALTEMRLLRPHLNPDNPDAVDTIWRALTTLGEGHDTRTVRQLRERLLAAHGRDDAFDDTEDKARDSAALSPGRQIAPGTYEYLLRVTREGRALLEAAIGPGSAPVPGPDGEPDPRPHTQRRAEALVAVISRALKAGDSTWSSTKAQVFVTIALADLQTHQTHQTHCGDVRAASSPAADGTGCPTGHGNTTSGSATGAATGAALGTPGAGTLLGALTTGDLVTPDTVRRWTCDATIIHRPRHHRRRRHPRPRHPPVHPRPDQTALATRPALHLPRLRRPRRLDRRPPPHPLGRRRRVRPVERSPALPTPPHHRPQQTPPRTPHHRHQRPTARHLGPHQRLLRRRTRHTSARPARRGPPPPRRRRTRTTTPTMTPRPDPARTASGGRRHPCGLWISGG